MRFFVRAALVLCLWSVLVGTPARALCIGIDTDGDMVCDDVDNCPADPNPDQSDVDGDASGDVCHRGHTLASHADPRRSLGSV